MGVSRAESDAKAKFVHALIAKGMTVNQISKEHGMCYQTVDYIAKKQPKPEKPPARMAKTDILNTCAYGIYFAKVAVRLGCKPLDAIDAVRDAGMVRVGGIPV